MGLGNPGPQYQDTRHNAGFWLVDRLARHYAGFFRNEPKYKGEACRISIGGQSVWLLKPLTFMNRSGESVASLARFYKFPLPAILLIHDELDLPIGTVRLKRGGGPGGHNGLRDTIRQLGGNDFIRLRIGIGHPGDSREGAQYVLRRAPVTEQRVLDEAISEAERLMPQIVSGQLQQAMHKLHSRKPLSPAVSTE